MFLSWCLCRIIYSSACRCNFSSSNRFRQSSCLCFRESTDRKGKFFACGHITQLEEETMPPSFQAILSSRIGSFFRADVFTLAALSLVLGPSVLIWNSHQLDSAEKEPCFCGEASPGGKAKTHFWNRSYATFVTFAFTVDKCSTIFFKTSLLISNRHRNPW